MAVESRVDDRTGRRKEDGFATRNVAETKADDVDEIVPMARSFVSVGKQLSFETAPGGARLAVNVSPPLGISGLGELTPDPLRLAVNVSPPPDASGILFTNREHTSHPVYKEQLQALPAHSEASVPIQSTRMPPVSCGQKRRLQEVVGHVSRRGKTKLRVVIICLSWEQSNWLPVVFGEGNW